MLDISWRESVPIGEALPGILSHHSPLLEKLKWGSSETAWERGGGARGVTDPERKEQWL